MKIIKGKWRLALYGLSGFGVNLLNLMMGSYLCSALLIGGFNAAHIPFQTFAQKDLVIAGAWAVFVMVAKIIDGIVDIPMASFTDKLKSRWGRRRPTILIGLAGLIVSYLLFILVIPENGATVGNTIFYGVVLCLFYTAYTLTMVTYYATFTEAVDGIGDRNFVSNVKSVFDIVYFIVGYVLVAMLLKGINIKWVALMVLPLVLTMLIPLFMLKEESTKGKKLDGETVNLFKSIAYTFRNRDFMLWMVVYAFMTFGLQLFLGGINEYFSYTGMSMMLVMATAFVPVPFTLILYNRIIRKWGFGFAFKYTLIVYAAGMLEMFGASFLVDGTAKAVFGVISGLICSFAIGSFFAVGYSIPAQLALEDERRTGIKHSAMYFAVQGLFSGVATGLATGVVLTALKETGGAMIYMSLICGAASLAAFALTWILPKSLNTLGKVEERPLKAPATAEDAADGTGGPD